MRESPGKPSGKPIRLYRQLMGYFHALGAFFFCILVAGQYVTIVKKMSAICIQFCKIIDCEMSDQIFNSGSKMFDKLFATRSSFF
jgi:hypothetical protein